MTDREIFEMYKEHVYYFCYYLMKNEADAEDICQEVFVKVIMADRTKVRNLKSWILRIASSELPDKIRMVVVLRFINELTVPEISKVMNIPVGTAKSRLSKGLKLLNKMVEPQLKEMKSNESFY